MARGVAHDVNVQDEKSHKRQDIQIFRGLAVFAVILFHGNESWFPNGYLGVDVFFVISGFVVTPLLKRVFVDTSSRGTVANLFRFYRRRFYRLAPALGTTLLGSAILILLLGPVNDHVRFAKQGFSTLLLLGNIGAYHYSGGDYFSPNPNPLVHMWSLSAEEQIYLILPLIFLFIALLSRVRKWNSFSRILICIGIFSFGLDTYLITFPHLLNSFGITNASQFEFFSPISRIWEFCLGGGAYLLSSKVSIPKYRIIGYTSILLLTLDLLLPIHFNNYRGILVSILATSILHFKALDSLPRAIAEISEWLGDRSYSIYLVHMPIIYIAHFSPVLGGVNQSIATIVALALSIAFGSASYTLVEERFRIRSDQDGSQRRPLKMLFTSFVIIPVLVFGLIVTAASSNYWSSNPNGTQPLDGGMLDSKCQRMESPTPCEYLVANARGQALLIGDSHAGAISQTFIDAMSKLHVSVFVWTKGSCQPIKTATLTQRERNLLAYGVRRTLGGQTCDEHNGAIWKWVAQHPKVTIFVNVRSSSDRPIGMKSDDFINLLASSIIDLSKKARKVILVGPNPEFPPSASYFSSPRVIWQLSSSYPRTYPVSRMIPESFQDDEFFQERFRRTEVEYLSVIGDFCQQNSCSRWDGSAWLYRDDNHLSIRGAAKLAALFESSFNRLNP